MFILFHFSFSQKKRILLKSIFLLNMISSMRHLRAMFSISPPENLNVAPNRIASFLDSDGSLEYQILAAFSGLGASNLILKRNLLSNAESRLSTKFDVANRIPSKFSSSSRSMFWMAFSVSAVEVAPALFRFPIMASASLNNRIGHIFSSFL